MKKDLLSIDDLSIEEIHSLFECAGQIKKYPLQSMLSQRSMAMIFEKPSLRTRVTFELGMVQLGGYAIYLQPVDIKLGERESVADVARNLERWVDIIMARTFKHSTIVEMAQYAKIPVINALSELEHPCQALADLFTVLEHRNNFDNFKMSFIGDGNNVCNSLMLLCAKLGSSFALACPKGYEPDKNIIGRTKELMKENGGDLTITNDIKEAVDGSDAIYTDVWVSMGQEDESTRKKEIFSRYQVNSQALKYAKPDALVMHCLPAHRGEEITDDVMDGRNSVVFDQAENRLHVQKAIILKLLKKDDKINKY